LFHLAGIDFAVAVGIGLPKERAGFVGGFVAGDFAVAVLIERHESLGGVAAAASAAKAGAAEARAAAHATLELFHGGRQFFPRDGAIAVGVGAAEHHLLAGIGDFVSREFAVAVLIGPHGHIDHLSWIAHRAAGAARTAAASFFLGDVAVAVGVELRQVGDCLAELGLADGAVAVDVKRGEEGIGTAESAEAAATEAAPFFTFAFAAAAETTAFALAPFSAFATLAARGVFFAEFGAGVASARGLGECRRGCQQAEGEGPTCFGHGLVLS
jgi:hypothetical protein